MSSPKKVKKSSKPSGPSTLQLVKDAIVALKDTKGSSGAAIKKQIAARGIVKSNALVNKALTKGVDTGVLKQVKGSGANGSFRLDIAKEKQAEKAKEQKAKAIAKRKEKAEKAKAAKAKKAATAKAKKATKKSVKKPTAKKPAAKKKAPKPKKAAKKPVKKVAKKPATKKTPKKKVQAKKTAKK